MVVNPACRGSGAGIGTVAVSCLCSDVRIEVVSHSHNFLCRKSVQDFISYLWDAHEKLTMSDDEIKQLCLIDIDKILHSYYKTLKDYPPMPLATEVDSSLLTERVIREELKFNRDDLKKNTSDMLAIATPEQKYAFDKIVTAIHCDEGNLMSAEIRSRGDIVLNITSSGIASLLLPNGRTAHSSGLCNGTRLQVRKIGNHVIECEVLMSNNVGHIALIPRMNMVPTNETVPVGFQ
ncbi:uncharacterized protein LOC107627148 [Arachis ipaensis]|uniref:uncharacterized protein LOC107627148 n=1 Tax=Arachis ipaensis TaxID=130454 RepID=UPI0007AEEF02|nr:uncharacterized protein LOC107627148 [Arachis ipaensis]